MLFFRFFHYDFGGIAQERFGFYVNVFRHQFSHFFQHFFSACGKVFRHIAAGTYLLDAAHYFSEFNYGKESDGCVKLPCDERSAAKGFLGLIGTVYWNKNPVK